jgi:hypothetical protein
MNRRSFARAGLIGVLVASSATLVTTLKSATNDVGQTNSSQTQASNPAARKANDPSAEANKAARELAYIENQKRLIRAKLRDPKSAEFRNVRICYSMGPIVCGQVNSNNGFGGKTGYQRFVSGGEIQVLEEEMEDGGMDAVWAKVCP